MLTLFKTYWRTILIVVLVVTNLITLFLLRIQLNVTQSQSQLVTTSVHNVVDSQNINFLFNTTSLGNTSAMTYSWEQISLSGVTNRYNMLSTFQMLFAKVIPTGDRVLLGFPVFVSKGEKKIASFTNSNTNFNSSKTEWRPLIKLFP